MCKFFRKYQNKFVDFLEEFWSFFTCKISYLWYQTQKSGSCSTFSYLRPTTIYQIWSRSNKKKSYANDPNNFQKNSFGSYLEELLLIELSLCLENFIAKHQKICEIKWFTHDWGTKATKVPHFSRFFISCLVWPKISHKPFDILQKKFLKSKITLSATILPNMSKNYQEIKPWRGLKIFENL